MFGVGPPHLAQPQRYIKRPAAYNIQVMPPPPPTPGVPSGLQHLSAVDELVFRRVKDLYDPPKGVKPNKDEPDAEATLPSTCKDKYLISSRDGRNNQHQQHVYFAYHTREQLGGGKKGYGYVAHFMSLVEDSRFLIPRLPMSYGKEVLRVELPKVKCCSREAANISDCQQSHLGAVQQGVWFLGIWHIVDHNDDKMFKISEKNNCSCPTEKRTFEVVNISTGEQVAEIIGTKNGSDYGVDEKSQYFSIAFLSSDLSVPQKALLMGAVLFVAFSASFGYETPPDNECTARAEQNA